MKRITLLIFGLLFAGFLQAQVSIGVRGGLSIPNLTSSGKDETPLSKGYSSKVGPGFAVFADFKVSNLFSIEPSIEYSAQGGKKDGGLSALPSDEILSQVPEQYLPIIQGAFPDGPPQYVYADYKSTAKFNYLLVPVLAKFGWDLGENSPWRVYAGAGPFVGFLLNAKQVSKGNAAASPIYLDEAGTQPVPDFIGQTAGPLALPIDNETDIKDDLHKVNVGLEGKVGFAYKINRSNIFIEGGGNYGFIKIQKDAVNGKNNTGAGIVMLGYSYTL